jgi:hypothetical protein
MSIRTGLRPDTPTGPSSTDSHVRTDVRTNGEGTDLAANMTLRNAREETR